MVQMRSHLLQLCLRRLAVVLRVRHRVREFLANEVQVARHHPVVLHGVELPHPVAGHPPVHLLRVERGAA
eukprot:8256776-Alexandrium_andersonii.AAC.1